MAEDTPAGGAGAGTPPAPIDRIENLNIEQELQDSYLTYAMSTIMDRALPDVRDGLKPSQRRILVAMNDLNLRPGSKHLKCAKIAGNTSGDYHPHGEAIVYPTLVRLGQHWNLRYPLIDAQGNFGSTDGDPPAAMRYTEARPTHVESELLADLDKETVDWQPNYDDRLMEPTVLPARFPNLLVNGSTGIAVGMACNLLPHNLREICDAIVRVIDNPDITLPELLEIVPGPDFPTGGIICGKDGIVDGYKTGRGRICLRAQIDVEEEKGGKPIIVISEMPYNVIRKSIVEATAAAVKNGFISDISAVDDHSGREHACRIVVGLKRDADPNVIIRQLYEYTPCQVTVSMINIALVNRQPRTMGLKELIQHFIAHRKEVITRRTRFLLRKAQQQAHVLEGQIFAVCDIDEVVKLIRSSKTREEAMEKLKARAFRIPADHPFAPRIPEALLARVRDKAAYLSQTQAEAIAALRLIQLVGLEIEQLVDKYRGLVEEIEGYEAILRDDNMVLDIIREDTFEIKEKYGDKRRTRIEGAVTDMNMKDLIANEEVVVTVSHEGYIKRLPADTYRAQTRGGRGIKGGETREGDFVQHLFVANTHDYLLFFTNQGRVYERNVYDVPQGSRTAMGRSIAQLLDFQKDEKVANVLAIQDFERGEQFLMFATRQGVVKKTALSAYGNIRQNGIIAIGLEEGDALIAVELTGGNDEILLGTKQGMAIRFKETDVRAMGRPAGGVKGIELAKAQPPEDQSGGADEVVSMVVVPAGLPASAGGAPAGGTTDGDAAGTPASLPACMILTACVNGFGKRTPVDEYRLQRRGGSGVINIKTTERNGNVVGMAAVCDDDELMLITEKGILIRTRVSEIRETGRNAAGVKLIRIDEGDRLVAMAKIDADAKVETEAGAAEGSEPQGEEPTQPSASDGETPEPPAAPE